MEYILPSSTEPAKAGIMIGRHHGPAGEQETFSDLVVHTIFQESFRYVDVDADRCKFLCSSRPEEP